MVRQALMELEKIYSPQFVNIIGSLLNYNLLALMLIFEESNRPSFVEIE